MLAERFIPRLFEQIAMLPRPIPRAICEISPRSKAPPIPRTNLADGKGRRGQSGQWLGPPARAGNALVTEWTSSQDPRLGEVKPPLANVDLRPYLFVTKDRKDYFGAASCWAIWQPWWKNCSDLNSRSKALEARIQAARSAGSGADIRGPTCPYRRRGSLETQPPGIDGFAVFVRAHPALQNGLVDFLKALPSERAAPGPCQVGKA